jgi:hypothetical protein
MYEVKLRQTFAAIAVAFVLVFATTGQYAFGDNVNADALDSSTNSVSVEQGATTDVEYWIVANGSDGCNVDASSTATVTLTVPSGVSASSTSLTFNACGTGAKQTVTYTGVTVGGPYSVTATATGGKSGNNGWNTAPATVSITVTEPSAPSDNTAPVITPNIAGTLGNNGWYVSDVTVSWTVTDPESAITSTSGCDATTINSDTTGTTLTCTATSAGGTSSQSVTIKRDATNPTVNVPSDITTFSSTNTKEVSFTVTFSDAISGLDGTEGCDYESGDAFPLGTTTVTCEATDNAGNYNSDSFTITVYQITGFYQPVDMNGVYNKGKAGNTIPFKFNIYGGTGEITDPLIVKSIKRIQVACPSGPSPSYPIEEYVTTTGGTVLRYDTTAGQFVYNGQSSKNDGNKCFTVTLYIDDGSTSGLATISANVQYIK